MPEMRAARDEEAPRRPYLKKGHFQEHGYTEDCEGCARLSSGMTKSAPHTEECRNILEGLLPEARTASAKTRLDQWVTEKGEDEIEAEQLQEAPRVEKDIVQRTDEVHGGEADSDMKDVLGEAG